ncbi:hypothetical protein Scep_016905 [Stephania cephalantha]|uniref:Uncharacterized protein n=1 Tax=Stephania cephalantha TaxID=152367 RepID=A0AAP0INP6_9MAGN
MELESSVRSECRPNNGINACIPIKVDYSVVFTHEDFFKTRDGLVCWAQKVGKENGFVFVIKHSNKGGNGRRGKVFLACEISGKYRGSKLQKGQVV